MTYYFDFDRTLFDTHRFFTALWDEINARYPRVAPDERHRYKRHATHHGRLYEYDFFAHLQAINVPATSEEIIAWLEGQQFLYDDALAALDAFPGQPVEILTYGGRKYQELKLATAAELANIPVTIILEPKGLFLAARPEASVLIDDKNLRGELPAHVTFVQLNRAQTEPVALIDGSYTINSLAHLREVIS